MWLKKIALILTIIGGLNWGLVGGFGFNLVDFLFGPMSLISQIVYILVGISAIVVIFSTCTCMRMEKKK